MPGWIADLARLMAGRHHDAAYAAARFVGLCHARIDGNLSLGITSNDLTVQDLEDHELLCEMSPGNAGFVVVDTADFTWRAYGGYLADRHPTTNQGSAT